MENRVTKKRKRSFKKLNSFDSFTTFELLRCNFPESVTNKTAPSGMPTKTD